MARSPDLIYEMNLARMEALLLERVPWTEIVTEMLGTGACGSESTCSAWRKEIRRRWAEEDAEERPHRRDAHRELLRNLYHQAYKTADFRCCERIAKQLMVLDGLQVPEQIVVTDGRSPIESMTVEQREQEIASLLAKREAAMRGLPKPPPRGAPS